MYEERFYRKWILNNSKLKTFFVKYKQTDICVSVDNNSYFVNLPDIAFSYLKLFYSELEKYILDDPKFNITFKPYIKPQANVPIIKEMMKASCRANVGPMASVAGAIAQYIGKALLEKYSINEIYIENGGDVFISSPKNVNTIFYTGNNSKFPQIKLQIESPGSSFGVCSSSGKFGHSFSFGKADAVMVVCKNTCLSDALATYFCNKIRSEEDIQKVLGLSSQYEEILGVACVYGNKLGLRGNLKIID